MPESFDEFDGPPQLKLRPYQVTALEKVYECWAQGLTRVLLDMATGCGKTTIFARSAQHEAEAGGKTLVIIDRDRLVRQTAKRIKDETGIDAEIEMAKDHASPYAQIVVASVQSLQSINRLTSFADDHFSFVVCDECQHSLSNSFSRILNYFHFGAASLAPDWMIPKKGEPYAAKARVLGVTATPDLASDRHLNEFYQKVAFRYQLVEAIEDGWLVPIEQLNVQLEIDIRSLRMGRTPNGSDFTDGSLSKLMIPVVDALAKQLHKYAGDRKTIAFVPSRECAERLAAAVTKLGMNGIYVSGQCKDVREKTERYIAGGPGTVMANAALYKEGADFPDTDCIGQFRATKVRSLYCQQTGRATRPLPGLVDQFDTAEERRAAIAASAKKFALVLDPLWRCELLDLCSWYDLFTDDPEVKKRAIASGKTDPIEAVREAERDLIAAIAKEARKHENKVARAINPLTFSLAVGEESLASFVPTEPWQARKPEPAQLEFIEKVGFNTHLIDNQGKADLLIKRHLERERLGRCTPKMMNQLRQMRKTDAMGRVLPMFTEEEIIMMPKGKAGKIIGTQSAKWRARDGRKAAEWERAMG